MHTMLIMSIIKLSCEGATQLKTKYQDEVEDEEDDDENGGG